jgi:hypothetical protein
MGTNMRRVCMLALFAAAFSSALLAQSASSDEQEIRKLISSRDDGKEMPRTSDRIFWSGALRRPIVGSEAAQVIPGDGEPANRVPGSERIRSTVRRIEIAQAKDFAYDYSDAELSFDVKSGRHFSFPLSTLRVWKRVAGVWTVVAEFHQPHVTVPQR